MFFHFLSDFAISLTRQGPLGTLNHDPDKPSRIYLLRGVHWILPAERAHDTLRWGMNPGRER